MVCAKSSCRFTKTQANGIGFPNAPTDKGRRIDERLNERDRSEIDLSRAMIEALFKNARFSAYSAIKP